MKFGESKLAKVDEFANAMEAAKEIMELIQSDAIFAIDEIARIIVKRTSPNIVHLKRIK